MALLFFPLILGPYKRNSKVLYLNTINGSMVNTKELYCCLITHIVLYLQSYLQLDYKLINDTQDNIKNDECICDDIFIHHTYSNPLYYVIILITRYKHYKKDIHK